DMSVVSLIFKGLQIKKSKVFGGTMRKIVVGVLLMALRIPGALFAEVKAYTVELVKDVGDVIDAAALDAGKQS
ncbi:secreted protein, partial [Candidatus Magnetobacterium bavaricum]